VKKQLLFDDFRGFCEEARRNIKTGPQPVA